ncbi:MAG TPA: POTRA domain-containing protein, partial [Acetobacteraceae bacterium]|nr:POTRA domain-containing protein [Acetobacteraceae bacterium]
MRTIVRALLIATACLVPALAAAPSAAQGNRPRQPARAAPARAAPGAEGTVREIEVRGNQRIEADTVRSYMLLQPGDAFDADRLDRSLKSLYATGLFRDVRIGRDGG